MSIALNEFTYHFNNLISNVRSKKLSFKDLRVVFTRSSGEDILAIMDNEDNVMDYMKWE